MVELLSGRIDIDDNFVIKEYYTSRGNIRILFYNDIPQSMTWIDDSKKYEIADYYYGYFFDLLVKLYNGGNNCLVLGGGAFTYPKYYISTYLDKKMTVVEINDKCVECARKYFYLDDLIEEYDPNGDRLEIVIEDAIKYVNNCTKKYDYVLINLFNGIDPIREIYSDEWLINLKNILNDKYVVVVNYIISNNNVSSYKDDISKLVTISKHYKIISNKNYFNKDTNKGNVLIILSNNDIRIPNYCIHIELDNIID